MKRIGAEAVGSLFWLAVGVSFAVGGIKLNPGTLRNPGPGFLPLVMSLLLICFSLFIVAKELLRPERFLEGIRWKSQVLIVASVFFYGLLLDVIGFLLSTFILMFILFGLRFSGKRRWRSVFFYAAATALAGWLVFSVTLSVPFPRARLTAVWR
jgi:hypothetical protein